MLTGIYGRVMVRCNINCCGAIGKSIIFIFQLIRRRIKRTNRPSKKPEDFSEDAMDQQQLSGIDASFLISRRPRPHARGGAHLLRASPRDSRAVSTGTSAASLKAACTPSRSSPSGWRRRSTISTIPAGVDDHDLDLDYHLRETTLPAPGSEAQLEEVDRPPACQHARSQPSALAVLHHHRVGQRPGRSLLESPSRRGRRRRRHGESTKALYDVTAIPREVEPPPPKPDTAAKPAPSSPTAVDPSRASPTS